MEHNNVQNASAQGAPAPAQGSVILSVEHLVTQFGSGEKTVTAVNDVSFTVERGKTLGIVGESGCGKSVTSLSIMRLIGFSGGTIAGGRILFDGRDLLALSEPEMRRIRGNEIAMIFQEPMTALNPLFTIGYQLEEVLCLHLGMTKKQARKRGVELLERVRIPRAERIMDEYPHQLSGGMRQRVMIAMAIACRPKVLIADEPTTALDVTIQAQVLELMKELVADLDMAIIFITHDLGVIAEMASDVLVMYAGRVVEQGTVEDIFESPRHVYTRGLMRSRPSLAEKNTRLACIPGMVPTLANLPNVGCAFAPRCEHASEQCVNRTPELTAFGGGHYARCWYAQSGEEGR